MNAKELLFLFAAVAVVGSVASATPIIEVGAGDNTAGVYVEFKDGFSVEFAVNFSADSMTGFDLIQLVAQETVLDTVVEDFGWGVFVGGISYDGHSDVGFGGGEDWWHYWIKDAGQDWVSPMFGASDRVVFDGHADGWVYGTDSIPEPATVLLLGIGGLLLRRKR